jgi:hypothetical protein
MSFRNMRNDVSKVPGWLLCICSVWERKCVATSPLMLLFYFWSKKERERTTKSEINIIKSILSFVRMKK